MDKKWFITLNSLQECKATLFTTGILYSATLIMTIHRSQENNLSDVEDVNSQQEMIVIIDTNQRFGQKSAIRWERSQPATNLKIPHS